MTAAPEIKRSVLRVEELSENGTFSGYASLFGKTDLGKDRVERGAFRKSLKVRGVAGVRMLYQHDPASPIGTWLDIREDAKGLLVKGRIVEDTPRGAEVLTLMRAGAVDGLSIGFKTIRSKPAGQAGVRSILEADLWEISIVTFPMLPQARVSQVKSGAGQALPSVRTFERWLTRDAGLSRSQAKTIIAKGFVHLSGQRDAAPTSADMAARIRQATALMQSHRT
ncbi:HK97 family phage prohead protease [Ahrensia sp. R2A130]|uniref:HK97 family phage prohead protease n=1 Tax=Ahrensia sp. R2A130 TaxID=744979 RepID=UPI0001E0E8BC|nr:HK97 family phage prohead protease [Ahrensia sp. R2A130]EFL88954.1 HK97 family phage prohead protease [Ahrensia sp. R2A130]